MDVLVQAVVFELDDMADALQAWVGEGNHGWRSAPKSNTCPRNLPTMGDVCFCICYVCMRSRCQSDAAHMEETIGKAQSVISDGKLCVHLLKACEGPPKRGRRPADPNASASEAAGLSEPLADPDASASEASAVVAAPREPAGFTTTKGAAHRAGPALAAASAAAIANSEVPICPLVDDNK